MKKDLLLGPFVLAANLVLFLGGEIIGNIESLTDLFRRFALDHVGNGLAADVQKSSDIEIIGSLFHP